MPSGLIEDGPFGPCWLRTERAKSQYQAFTSEWQAFLDRKPYQRRTDFQPDGNGVVYIALDEQPPPLLGILVGEMLYNWRAALNNLVYMAAIIDTGLDPPEGGPGLEFPICPVSETFKRNRHKLKGLTDEHQGWIETVQPYQAPEAYQRHPLWCLHELSRVDRHRAVHVVNGFLNSHVSIEVEPRTPGMSVQSVWVVPAGRLEDGAVLGGFTVTPPTGEVGVRAQYSGQVDIDEALALDDRLLGIRDRLGAIHDTVRGLITQFHNGVK